MKKTLLLMVLTGITVASLGCIARPRDDIHTHTFSVPKITSPDCSKLILGVLGKTAGITKVETNTTNGTATVSFDTKITALKNVEFALAEAGFDVDESTGRPDARARLPEGCR